MRWYHIPELLPPVYRQVKSMFAVADAEDIELRNYLDLTNHVWENFFIQTCDLETIEYWERLLEIDLYGTETIEERRDQIILYLSNNQPITDPYAKEVLKRMFGDGNWTYEHDPDNNLILNIEIRNATDDQQRRFLQWFSRVCPAHIYWKAGRVQQVEMDMAATLNVQGVYNSFVRCVAPPVPPILGIKFGGWLSPDGHKDFFVPENEPLLTVDNIELYGVGPKTGVVQSVEMWPTDTGEPLAVDATMLSPAAIPMYDMSSSKYEVFLESYPAETKMQLIKAVRTVYDLGIAEAKTLVESAPVVLSTHESSFEARSTLTALQNAAEISTATVYTRETSTFKPSEYKSSYVYDMDFDSTPNTQFMYSVYLESYPDETKMQLIAAVRAVYNLGLSEAKSLVERAPVSLSYHSTQEEAQATLAALQNAASISTASVYVISCIADVFLESYASSKLKVTRAVQSVYGITLSEAADIVNQTPVTLSRHATMTEAQEKVTELYNAQDIGTATIYARQASHTLNDLYKSGVVTVSGSTNNTLGVLIRARNIGTEFHGTMGSAIANLYNKQFMTVDNISLTGIKQPMGGTMEKYTPLPTVSVSGDFGENNWLYCDDSGHNRTLSPDEIIYVYSLSGSAYWDDTKSYGVILWSTFQDSQGHGHWGFSLEKGSNNNYFYARNISTNTLYLYALRVAVCSSSSATVITVYDSSNNPYNAFKYTLDGTDYYYVLDGTQTDWTDDLSGIGYHVIYTAWLTPQGAQSQSEDVYQNSITYAVYDSNGNLVSLQSDKTYTGVKRYRLDGSEQTYGSLYFPYNRSLSYLNFQVDGNQYLYYFTYTVS